MARFFISYARPDVIWAERVAGYLREAGHETVLDREQFRPGNSLHEAIAQALRSTDWVIAILTPAYLERWWTKAESRAAFRMNKLLPVMVRKVDPDPLFSDLINIDLVDREENEAARDILLKSIERTLGQVKGDAGRAEGANPPIPEPSEGLSPQSRMPHPRPSRFVDRLAEVRTIAELLDLESTNSGRTHIPTVIIAGPEGIGKTLLAREFVYRFAAAFTGGVFWISAVNHMVARSEVADCLPFLRASQDFEKLSLERQKTEVYRFWTQPVRRLLVLDNCQEPELVSLLRPAHGGCRVLVTSRKSDWGDETALHVRSLAPLDRADSLNLLRMYRAFEGAADEVLSNIANELGDHPGALHVAASSAYRSRISPSDLLVELREMSVEGQLGILEDLRFLEKYEALAWDLLSMAAGVTPGRPVLYRLLLDAANIQQANLRREAVAALSLLDQMGLIEFGRDNVVIQPFIAKVVSAVRQRMELGDSQLAAVMGFTRMLDDWNEAASEILPIPGKEQMIDLSTLLGDRDELEVGRFLHSLGRHLASLDSLDIASPLLERALAIFEAKTGDESPLVWQVLQSLGELHRRLGNFGPARAYYERAVKSRCRVSGRRHPGLAESLNRLGLLCKELGDWRKARSHYRSALAIFRRAYGRSDPQVVPLLNNLGVLERESGDLEQARNLHLEALAICEAAPDRSRPDLAESLHDLGAVFAGLEHLGEALDFFQRALILRRVIFGSEHTYVADTLAWMGSVLDKAGQEGAMEAFQEALSIYQDRLGSEHPRTARMRDLVDSLRSTNRVPE